jgi:hypothetical protein
MSKEKSTQKLSDRYSSTGSTSTTGMVAGAAAKGSTLLSMPVVVSTAVAVVAVGGIVAFTSLSGNNTGTDSDSVAAYNLVVTPDESDEDSTETVSKAAAGTYDVSMNSTWEFADAKSASSNASVDNLSSNTNTVYFIVTRDDTGTMIYKSPYIPVGGSLSNIKLSDESLAKGTYPCTLTYHLVDDNYEDISTLNISVSIVIQND